MSDLDHFGASVLSKDVADAVQATIEAWEPEYREWFKRARNLALQIPKPGSYVVTSDWDHFPEEKLPAIQIVHGEVKKPRLDGRRQYRAMFPIQVGVFVEARDRQTTEDLASLYGGVIREIIVQKGSLGGLAVQSCWEGEASGVHVTDTSKRTIGTCIIDFTIDVRNIATRFGGVPEPRSVEHVQEPPADTPVVTKQTPVTLSPEPITT